MSEQRMSKVAVFSAGSWGTAFSIVLADAGNDVTLWARREEVATTINEQPREPRLPARHRAAADASGPRHDAERGAGRGRHRRARRARPRRCASNLTEWAPYIARDAVLVSLMKGVELGTLDRMSEVIAEVTGAGPERIAVVSGPNLAREIARREPAASVVACADEEVAKRIQDRMPLAGVPALHQHRRARLRARRRLQERRRPRGRHGGRARASATTPRPR